MLAGLLGLNGALGKALDSKTRARIALTVAQANRCNYCLSAHGYLRANLVKLDQAEMAANRRSRSNYVKADAAVVFARQVADAKGRVSDADIAAVKLAGYSEAQIIEIVALVAVNMLTNYINNVADVDIASPSCAPRTPHDPCRQALVPPAGHTVKAVVMGHRFLELATTPAARTAQVAAGSRAAYARMEGGRPIHDRMGEKEEAFIAARDSFYLASVNDTGWPYIQHRGGPPGFLKVIDERRLGFSDLAGNKQFLTLGNIQTDNRVALFLMDYPNRRRLKLLGRLRSIDCNGPLAEQLVDPDYPARVERGFVIQVEGFDWNCPQHITPRFTEAELAQALAPVREQISQLTTENEALRARIARLEEETRS